MKNHQGGFTLVELMISLVLGLFLIAGISELFLQSQKTYRTQRSLSYMMEDGRYVLEMLSKELRHTGFLRNRNASDGLPSKVFLPDSVALGTGIAPTIDLDEKEFIHGENGDAFVIRYQLNDKSDLSTIDPSNSSSPCSRDIGLDVGEDPANETHVVTTYFYVANDGGDRVLYCKAKRETIDLANNIIVCMKPASGCSTPTAQPIISNVEKVIVKYGVDFNIKADGTPEVELQRNPDGTVIHDINGNEVPILDLDGNPVPSLDGSANYYVDADNVGDWKRVVSAKLYVVIRSEDDDLTQGNSSYTIEGTTYTSADNRFYRVFSTTIAFRNQV